MAARFASIALALALGAVCAAAPITVHGQSDQLRAAIRAELLKDGRAQGLSEAQLTLLVEALAAEAAEQGVRAQDISPQFAEPESAAPAVSDTVLSAIILSLLALMCVVAVWLGLHRKPALSV